MEDVYEKLATHLDSLPAGFPRTESGVEMRVLRRLFTPEDAELAIRLTIIPEEARVIARRAGISVSEATERLDALDKKGLIMRTQQNEEPPRYMALQYVLGFWEGQVNRLTPELVEDALEYEPAYIQPDHWRKAPQMRTIPVGKSIELRHDVMPYEIAEDVIRSNTGFAVSNCICRQAMRLLGQGCEKPEESCLTLGSIADYIVQSGRGRKIDVVETLDILQRAEESGLVLQPDNAQEPLFMCTCCGCCCGILRSLKRSPKPGESVCSPFSARLDGRACTGCGRCAERCQMEAISWNDGKAVLDVDRCIGCGLCVSTCPNQCLTLVRKPPSEQPKIPKDHAESALNVGRARGRLGLGELIRMQIKSKLDRLLAPPSSR
ncbi:MAG: 4Fe-4S dicluster domain-containing protein [Planctomycetota bacterium]